jgi:DNA-binding XRE family transcriptional regulator
MAHSTKIRSKALRSLYDRYIKDDPERVASVEREMLNAEIAQNLYDLRQEARLTQVELAEKAGVDVVAISDLEEADYQGDSLEMLRKIAAALGKKVEVKYLRSEFSDQSRRDIPSQGVELAIY